MKHILRKPFQWGLTLIEISLSLALISIGLLAVADSIPGLVQRANELRISNNLRTLLSLKENLRGDISAAGSGDIQTTSRYSIYVCQYGSNASNPSECTPLSSPNFNAQGLVHKECVASAASGQLVSNDRSVIRIAVYRGYGNRLEYFYAEVPWNETELIETTLATVCTTPFNTAPTGIAQGKWILMNNTEVYGLNSFSACGVDNAGMSSFIQHGPPQGCVLPVNQIGSDPSTKCSPGVNGLNAIALYYKFDVQNSSTDREASFSDVSIIPLTNRPCINDASTND
ncbi:type II secretion system GspH family protein [Limnobacter humi]|uniref:Type II secretion system GspH family protein n=1 Tax=Limnobacter humi TaxID=1778671 RepID=A0ABT1WKV3_9BURK|nr:type II secretion system protein [Limnobacter humi]MCQ8897324.1 type II secretion system GspH family protein [Limnobacter humi]